MTTPSALKAASFQQDLETIRTPLFQSGGVLSKHIEEITMMQLRARIGEIIQEVKLGKAFVLVHGIKRKRIAVLQQPPGETLIINVDENGKVSYGR